jgi:hypothetical protein
MNIFQDEHLDILKILLKHDVEFMLVGGVAVNYYGFTRPTGDLDVWLKPVEENKKKLIKALTELKIVKEDIAVINAADFSQPIVFHIGNTPPFVIDFMTKISGVNWQEAWTKRNDSEFEGLKLSFIHINDLKANKFMSGRPKDLEDIKQLLRIEELRKRK